MQARTEINAIESSGLTNPQNLVVASNSIPASSSAVMVNKKNIFSEQINAILEASLAISVYPAVPEKKRLEAETGLKRPQIDNWFTNQRKRRDLPGVKSKSKKSTITKPTETRTITITNNPELFTVPTRKSNSKFPKAITAKLNELLKAKKTLNESLEELASADLTKQQIENWFKNTRKRHSKKPEPLSETAATTTTTTSSKPHTAEVPDAFYANVLVALGEKQVPAAPFDVSVSIPVPRYTQSLGFFARLPGATIVPPPAEQFSEQESNDLKINLKN